MKDWWSSPSDEDLRCITAQLQRKPRQVIAVARRCRFGFPQVVVTNPVVWGPLRRSEKKAGGSEQAPRVFPTLYWLTCPYLVSAVGRLESQGWVSKLKVWLEAEGLQEAWTDVHRRAAAERVAVLPEEHGRLMRQVHASQWQVLVSSGVGGMRGVEGIKCLHAHLGDYLAGAVGDERTSAGADDVSGSRNPVGAKTLALLLRHGVDVSGCWDGICGEPPTIRRMVAIDVGSNSCRMLAVDVDDVGRQHRAAAALHSTRLAEGLQAHGALTPGAVERTLSALEMLRRAGYDRRSKNEVQVLAVATQAMREAANPEVLLWPAWERLGLALRVISGEQEARLAFTGISAGLGDEYPGANVIGVLDIGGGSTEIVVGTPENGMSWSVSVKAGAVRLTDYVLSYGKEAAEDVHALTEAAYETLRQDLASASDLLSDEDALLIGVGGTLTSLAAIDLKLEAYDPQRVQGHVLTHRRIAEIAEWLAALPLAQRQQVPGLQPERADIIVAGAAIALAAMDLLQKRRIIISEADMLQGMIETFQVRKEP
ncbi:MAG: DUF501 domain-containing protein [Limnochordia bacterium]